MSRCNDPVFEFSKVCQICGCELEGNYFEDYDNSFYSDGSNRDGDIVVEDKSIGNFYNNSLSKLGCVRHDHSKVIYAVENMFFGYMPKTYLGQSNFIRQKLERPHISSVLYETQANYELISKP